MSGIEPPEGVGGGKADGAYDYCQEWLPQQKILIGVKFAS